MSYRDRVMEHLRLTLLRLLAEVQGYASNSAILADSVIAFGLRVSRDQVHSELSWLAEQGLVKTEPVASVITATLTQRGLDVAQGRAAVPGIAKPEPGA